MQIYNGRYPLVKPFFHFFQILWKNIPIFVYFCNIYQILYQHLWTMALVTRTVAALRTFAMPSRYGVKRGDNLCAELSYRLLNLRTLYLNRVEAASLPKTCWDSGLKIAPVPNPG